MTEAGLRPEKAARTSTDFSSYEDAVQYFLRVANMSDAWSCFPDLVQRRLFSVDEEHNR